MSISGLAQFILGFLLGVFVLTGTGAAAAYLFLNRLSEAPPKPTYSEKDSSDTASQQGESNSEQQQVATETTTTSTPSQPKPEKPQTLEERFGEQAYKARVTWPNGLSLRGSPSLSAERIGGVYYDDQVVVIERSSDGDWQKVYIPETGQQAWVKAGNVEKIN